MDLNTTCNNAGQTDSFSLSAELHNTHAVILNFYFWDFFLLLFFTMIDQNHL
jgi:hypothetical protein